MGELVFTALFAAIGLLTIVRAPKIAESQRWYGLSNDLTWNTRVYRAAGIGLVAAASVTLAGGTQDHVTVAILLFPLTLAAYWLHDFRHMDNEEERP